MFKWLCTIAFVVFSVFNFWILREPGYFSVFPPFKNPAQFQMFVDIGVSAGLVNLWIFLDLKKHGKSAILGVVFFVLTILSGSMAPLLYVTLRAWGVFGEMEQPGGEVVG